MDNKKDDLNVLGAIRPAHDEVSSYRRSSRAEAPKQSNFNGILVFVIFVLAIMMGIGGYSLYEVQKKLDQSNVLLAKGQESVLELERRLAATGTDVSKTLQNMQGQMDVNVSEIDKLWGVAYRQNRPNIKKNQLAIDKVSVDVKNNLVPLKLTVGKISSRFDALSVDMVEVKQNLIIDNEEMATEVSMVRGQIQDQTVQVEGTKRNVAVLTRQMKEAQESIDVIDRYRIQLNQKLLQLERLIQDQDVSAAQIPAPATTPVEAGN